MNPEDIRKVVVGNLQQIDQEAKRLVAQAKGLPVDNIKVERLADQVIDGVIRLASKELRDVEVDLDLLRQYLPVAMARVLQTKPRGRPKKADIFAGLSAFVGRLVKGEN